MSGRPAQAYPQPIAATRGSPARIPMSLSRSPSPQPGGGWSTPGLTDDSRHGTSRRRDCGDLNGFASNDIALAAAKAKSNQVRNTPSFKTRNEGFFSRQRRKISATLPRFNAFNPTHKDWNAEKVGRGPWRQVGGGQWSRLKTLAGNLLRKFKLLIVVLVLIALTTILWSKSSKCLHEVAERREAPY
jgi:mannan polymerase II complex MNN10 subunit